MKRTALLLLPVLLLLSCSVQKRKYQKGFYIGWHKHSAEPAKGPAPGSRPEQATAELSGSAAMLQPEANAVFASAAAAPKLPELAKPMFVKDEPCDEIVFKSGSQQKAKIIEITGSEVKYKKCDLPDGPLYIARKSEIFMVKYANGTSETFKTELAPLPERPLTAAHRRTHPAAIAAFVFAIPAIYPLLGFLGIPAIIFASVALKQIKKYPDIYKGNGLANTAKIIGIIALCIFLLIVLLILAFI